MNTIDLPIFPYHRDPIASGSVIESELSCECCAKARGVIYSGNIYTSKKVLTLCPWCIADGSAAAKYKAQFFDADFCDDDLNRVELPLEQHLAVFGKTIGFATFNPIGWWVHCAQPTEYITREEPYDMIFECKKCGQRHVIQDLD
jgi:uncharacterized protein